MKDPMTEKRLPKNWTGRSKAGSWGNRCFMFLIRHLGIFPAYALLVFVSFGYALRDRESSRAISDLRTRLGLPTGLIYRWRHIFHFGTSLVDRFAFLLGTAGRFNYECVGEEMIAQAAREGKGAILLSAHLGNWELAGNLLHDRIETPINVIALDNERADVSAIFETATQYRRIKVLHLSDHHSDITVQIMNALRKGEFVCLHGDRIVDQRSETVEFLGGMARFPIGPYVLSSVCQCPIIPVFVVKTGWRSYRMKAFSPIQVPKAAAEERTKVFKEAMTSFATLLEDVVRNYPFEWHNFYPFWASSDEYTERSSNRAEEKRSLRNATRSS